MKLINMIICASLAATPLLTNAGDLKISNNSKYDLSFEINHVCANAFGVIPTGTIKVIREKDFNKACEYMPKYCVTNVYSKANCEGSPIAQIGFDTTYGVSYLSGSTSTPLTLSGNGFNLFLPRS